MRKSKVIAAAVLFVVLVASGVRAEPGVQSEGAAAEQGSGSEQTDGEKKTGSEEAATAQERTLSIALTEEAEPDENGAYPVSGEAAALRLEVRDMEAGIRAVRWGTDTESVCTIFRATEQWQAGDELDGWEVSEAAEGTVTGLTRVVRLAATEAVRSVTLEADDCAGATAPAATLRYYRAGHTSGDESGAGSSTGSGGQSGAGSDTGSGGQGDGEGGAGSGGQSGAGGGTGSGGQGGAGGDIGSGEHSGEGSDTGSGEQSGAGSGIGSGGQGDGEGNTGSGGQDGGSQSGSGQDRGTEIAVPGGDGTGTANGESAAKIDVRGVEQEGLYTGDVRGEISLRDADTGSSTVRLLKVNADGSTEDVSDRFLQGGDAAVRLRIPQAGHANDGIYRLEVDARDAAGNVRREQRIFSVNTAGSLFAYSAALESMRGAFLREVPHAIRVTEYNPAPIRAGSTRIEILCDGALIDVSRIRQTIEEGGTDGWHRCIYEIPADCFEQEGVYQVNVICLDAAGHAAESALTQGPVSFTIDRTPPQVRHVRIRAARDQEEGTAKGRTDAAVRSGRVLAYEAFDAAGLASAVVYAGEDELERRDDFLGEVRVSTEAGLPEEEPAGGFRLVVADRAGNETEERIDVPRSVGGAAVRRVFAGVPGRLAAVILAACAALAAGVLRALRRIDK